LILLWIALQEACKINIAISFTYLFGEDTARHAVINGNAMTTAYIDMNFNTALVLTLYKKPLAWTF
jgi:hypothetical protein